MYETIATDSLSKVTPLAIGKGTRIAKSGTILILVRGSMLFNRVPICIAGRDVAFNQDVKALELSSDVHSMFLLYQLLGAQRRIPVDRTGIGAGKVEMDALREFQVLLPSIDEQEKVAECVKSVVELIAAQEQKVEGLRKLKRGLMQNLFPQEGETLPRLRFPEFEDESEWESRPFDAFVERSFYGTSSSTSDAGEYPVLRMGNMQDGRIDFSNLVYLDLDAKAFESLRLKRGDILLNRTNSLDLVGKISLFDEDIDCITASYIVTYRLHRRTLHPVFCNQLLNTPTYKAKTKAMARPSVSQANINPTTFRKELTLTVPSLPEQERIADCFVSLDSLIAGQKHRLSVLKSHKQALMQGLFPSTEGDMS